MRQKKSLFHACNIIYLVLNHHLLVVYTIARIARARAAYEEKLEKRHPVTVYIHIDLFFRLLLMLSIYFVSSILLNSVIIYEVLSLIAN